MTTPAHKTGRTAKMYTHMGHTHEVQWPHLSDTEIAHTVRMLTRYDLNHEAVVCAARDRMLYLIDRVESLENLLALGADDLDFVLKDLLKHRPGSYRASSTLTEIRAALSASRSTGDQS